MYHQLLNYHTYALNIMDNMKAIQQAEFADPYIQNMRTIRGRNKIENSGLESINPYGQQLRVIYGVDGKAKFVDKNHSNEKYKGEWEKQFDQNVVNPPCMTLPPSNVWGLPMKN